MSNLSPFHDFDFHGENFEINEPRGRSIFQRDAYIYPNGCGGYFLPNLGDLRHPFKNSIKLSISFTEKKASPHPKCGRKKEQGKRRREGNGSCNSINGKRV